MINSETFIQNFLESCGKTKSADMIIKRDGISGLIGVVLDLCSYHSETGQAFKSNNATFNNFLDRFGEIVFEWLNDKDPVISRLGAFGLYVGRHGNNLSFYPSSHQNWPEGIEVKVRDCLNQQLKENNIEFLIHEDFQKSVSDDKIIIHGTLSISKQFPGLILSGQPTTIDTSWAKGITGMYAHIQMGETYGFLHEEPADFEMLSNEPIKLDYPGEMFSLKLAFQVAVLNEGDKDDRWFRYHAFYTGGNTAARNTIQLNSIESSPT